MENQEIFNSVEPVADPTLATTDEIIPAVEPMSAELTPDCIGCENTVPTVSENDSITRGCFFGTLQECVSIVWRFHLKTRKYSVHMALNEFYTEALDIVDDIIERYQGVFSVIDEPFSNCILGEGKTEVEYLNELKDFVKKNTPLIICDNGDIQSRVDDFVGLIDSTIYKLTSFCEHNIKSYDEFCYENLNESYSYDRFGERTCDDPNDSDYDPDFAEEE